LVAAIASVTYPEMVAGLAMLSLPDVAQRREMIPKLLQPLVLFTEKLFLNPLLLHPLFRFVRRRSLLKNWLKLAYPQHPEAVTEELLDIIEAPTHDQGAAEAFIALSRSVNQPEFCPPMKKILPQLTIPTLLIWGKGDRFVPYKMAPSLAQLNTRITLISLDGLGHCPHDEAPDQITPLLLDLLNKV
jgi:pimeloyl-ACP methyl ester carboxylesterase